MAAAIDPAAGRGGRGGGAAAPPVQVKIVWDGIDRRITQLTRMPGSVSYVVPAPDSRTYLFSAQGGGTDDAGGAGGGPGMYTINEDGTRLTRLNTTATDAGGAGRGRGGAAADSAAAASRSGAATAAAFTSCRAAASTRCRSAAAPATDTAAAAAAGGRGGRGGRGGAAARSPCDGNGVRRRGSAAHSLLGEDGDRHHRRTPPGLRRGLARDEESLLRSQNARRQLGRGQGQVRGHAAPHRRHRGAAQRDHGDDRRYERLPHRDHRRQPAARAGAAGGAHRDALSRLRPGARCERLLQGGLHLPQGSGRSRLRQDRARQLHPRR